MPKILEPLFSDVDDIRIDAEKDDIDLVSWAKDR